MRRSPMRCFGTVLALWCACLTAAAADGNRLAYLEGDSPYYPGLHFPKLVTPQWVGEPGVEAVVVLAIDDMRDPKKYEAFLRPILQRLKQIDGRASLSIMTCSVRPDDPQLKSWLDEGVSLEVHTVDHPCPLLQKGDFARAKSTYDRCVETVGRIPGNEPVAFRMPCCDSLNTISPRFFAEIFAKTTPGGRFLQIDSSVFNLLTDEDPRHPHAWVMGRGWTERFGKYVPRDRTFVNLIRNYPYPYVIDRLCWEFPCIVPSDWSAQHFQKPNNPQTVDDWKTALDLTVIDQGVMNVVFHPHGWIRAEQIVQLIDHAVATHGRKVKFLSFRDALERINKNLLLGNPLRGSAGRDNGVRLLDVNDDGFMDVVIGNKDARLTRIWSPQAATWMTTGFPARFDDGSPANSSATKSSATNSPASNSSASRSAPVTDSSAAGSLPAAQRGPRLRFAVLGRHALGPTSVVVTASADSPGPSAWDFNGKEWVPAKWTARPASSRPSELRPDRLAAAGALLFRDLDGDGVCEAIVGEGSGTGVFHLVDGASGPTWSRLAFDLPPETPVTDADGAHGALRLVDVDGDGDLDALFSDSHRYALDLFESPEKGWATRVFAKRRVAKSADGPPPFVRADGTNNGAWIGEGSVWVQNEDTASMKDLIDRRGFDGWLKDVAVGPLSPERSLAAIKVRRGFKVELVAAEPLIVDPVAFEWGADGKLWVVEMRDYPLGLDNAGKPGGRVKLLEDSDGDGRYDRATVFLDDLNFPNGVLPWKNGVLVTAAPDIIFAADTDGDGRADVRDVLYRGFGEGNQQHRVNGLVRGLDNWIYCANGDSGGSIKSMQTGQEQSIRGRDFRIRPETGRFETEFGTTQFLRSRDDWGNWFGNSNADPMWHYVLESRYINRSSTTFAAAVRQDVSVDPGPSRCYPASRTQQRFNDYAMAEHFTSACSAMVYGDELFGADFTGNSFVSEPVHNLIHRELVTRRGITFTSRRADDEQKSEFLASRDNWFRPTMLKIGPDGALYFADMYRKVIEHPAYIPARLQQGVDFRAGADRGRIYRVFPADKRLRQPFALASESTSALVAALDSPNRWQRDTAQQLLVERLDAAAVAPLVRLATEGKLPAGRLHALWTLDGQQSLAIDVVQRALADPHWSVRRAALRLAEPRVGSSPALAEAVVRAADDPDALVALQAACSLGFVKGDRAAEALGRLAVKYGDDSFFITAVLSSLGKESVIPVTASVLSGSQTAVPEAAIARLLNAAVLLDSDRALAVALAAATRPETLRLDPAVAFARLAAIAQSLDRLGKSLDRAEDALPKEVRAHLPRLDVILAKARDQLKNADATDDVRIAAVKVLALRAKDLPGDMVLLADMLVPRNSTSLQLAAVSRLGEIANDKVPVLLLQGWKSHHPSVRDRIIEVLLRRRYWTRILLNAVESRAIGTSEIGASQWQEILRSAERSHREQATRILAGSLDPDRQRVIDRLRPTLTVPGDAARGKSLFVKHCGTCHKLGDAGQNVGPDLASRKDKSPESLLIAVLDPSRNVESKFVAYVATTTSGRTFTGILADESADGLVLIGPKGERIELLRSQIEELNSTGKSLMPDGLEKETSAQDLADIIAFVRGFDAQAR